MKHLPIMFLAGIVSISVSAQKNYVKNLDGIDWVRISSKSDIVVKTHSKNQLLIKTASYKDSLGIDTIPNLKKITKGLKLVGIIEDNTELGYYVTKEGNELFVKNLNEKNGHRITTEIYLPSSQNISLKNLMFGSIEISGIKGEIEASTIMGDILIKGATGPITANSESGSINVTFNSLNQSLPSFISTVVGLIDVSIPENAPADFGLHSTLGEIYTDFKFDISNKDGFNMTSQKKINTSINNGGVKIKLSAVSGNIYLRKIINKQ